MPDAHKNFSYSTVATAPSPATSGTSLVVASGDGTKFPAVPFNATIWPANSQPLTSNAEIVRVTNISTDTLTITRTQESTSARTVVVGDQIAATITNKTLTDVEGMSVGGDLTGTLPNPTLSGTANVESIVRANSLDQFTSPAADVSWNSKNLTAVSTLTAATVQGSTSASGTLILNSTSSATAGTVAVGASSLGSQIAAFDILDVANATAVTMNGTGITLKGVDVAPVATFNNPSGGALSTMWNGLADTSTIQGTTGGSNTMRGLYMSFYANPTLKTLDTNAQILDSFSSFHANPALSVFAAGGLTLTQLNGFFAAAATVPSGATVTALTSFSAGGGVASSGGTITTYSGFKITNPGASAGTFTTMYGIDIASLTRASTNVGIRNSSTMRQVGLLTIGADAAATWLIHLQGGNAANSAIGMDVSTTGPTNASSNTSATISIYKGTNYFFLINFNDGGTQRYKYLQLNGTGTTWAQGTSLPT